MVKASAQNHRFYRQVNTIRNRALFPAWALVLGRNRKLLMTIAFLCVLSFAHGQAKFIQGIVFDKNSSQRVGKVLLKNERTNDNTFNNSRGEFEIEVEPGDRIITEKEGYHADTLIYTDQQIFIIYLKRIAIYIPEVNVVARRSPDEVLKQRREDYNKAYKLADPGDFFSVGPTGAGVSINSIYSLFSKEAKNAKRLTKIFRREYEENTIDYKFTAELVIDLTGLSGEQLKIFMLNYRPTYNFVMQATPYELSEYIKSKYEIFKLNPNLRFLPKLPDIDLEVNN